jgi:hypothetical protein
MKFVRWLTLRIRVQLLCLLLVAKAAIKREHIRCIWHLGVHYAHIKSDPSILDPTLFT